MDKALQAMPPHTTTPTAADTYPHPEHGWTCFFCGQTFTTFGAARDHFGADPSKTTACLIKAGDELGLVMELRKAEKAITAERETSRRLASALEEIGMKCDIAASLGSKTPLVPAFQQIVRTALEPYNKRKINM